MRTVGRRRPPNSPLGETTALCAICGTLWYRSELDYDSSGRLICPQDQGGLDETDLARLTVPSPRRIPRGDPGQASSRIYDFRQSLDVVAYFTAGYGAQEVSDEVVSLRAQLGKWLLNEPGALGYSGAGPGLLSSDSQFNGEPSFVGDGTAGTLLLSNNAFWANGDVPWAFFVGRHDLLTGTSMMVNSNGFQLSSQLGIPRGYVSYGPSASVTLVSTETIDTGPHLFEVGVLDDVAYLLVDGEEKASAAAGPIALLDTSSLANPSGLGGWHFLAPIAFRGHWPAALLVKNPTEAGLATARAELQRIYL